MRHFLFVGDPGGTSTKPRPREVLGVWCVDTESAAQKLMLKLSLMYPDCSTIFHRTEDFEALKAQHAEYEFGGLEPDLVVS
jgi:hypothetical protein